MRVVCFKTGILKNSFNLYWQRAQDRLMDVVRPLVGGMLQLVWHWTYWDDETVFTPFRGLFRATPGDRGRLRVLYLLGLL
jgi:hypothetical protein